MFQAVTFQCPQERGQFCPLQNPSNSVLCRTRAILSSAEPEQFCPLQNPRTRVPRLLPIHFPPPPDFAINLIREASTLESSNVLVLHGERRTTGAG
jgi:hypothetical protein